MSIDRMTEIAELVAHYAIKKDFVYCIEQNLFYIYEDSYWKPKYDMQVLKLIKESGIFNDIDEVPIPKRKQIIENLKYELQKELSEFNSHGYLNFDFGEFDPAYRKPFSSPAGAWHEHKKENYSTIRIDYPYMSSQSCELWLRTLNEILEGDKNKINTIQDFFGYCLTRETLQRKALLLLGESNCGKSTILQVLRALVGKHNCSNVPLDYIDHPQYTSMLINKLVNVDSDVSHVSKGFEAQFKIITSGEPVQCNQKFIPAFDFLPYCKFVMAANKFPKITDHSSAVYNRLIVIPCNRIFEDHEQNKNLSLQLNDELFGIFLWATAGLERLYQRGKFEQYDFAKEAVRELENDNNPSNNFFEEHIIEEINKDTFLDKKFIYEKYKDWCKVNGHFVLSIINFNRSLYKKYLKVTPKNFQKVTDGKRYWQNLKYVESKQDVTVNYTETVISWTD